jgi:hypothetical protein
MFIRHGPILAEDAESGNQWERRSYLRSAVGGIV